MNEIHFYCIHCGQYLEVTINMAGKECECPKCKQSITIPIPPTTPNKETVPVQSLQCKPPPLPMPLQNTVKETPPKAILWLLLVGGLLLYCTSSARILNIICGAIGLTEVEWHFEVLANSGWWLHSLGEMIGRVLIPIIFITPIIHYSEPKAQRSSFFPKMKHVVMAIYIGFAISMFWNIMIMLKIVKG